VLGDRDPLPLVHEISLI